MPRKIILDCDPGQDDAINILLTLASPDDLDLRAITTVGGNVPLARTTENALKLVELAGRPEVPVHPGCARPLLNPPVTAEEIHGATGLDGADLPEPTTAPRDEHAVLAILRHLRENEPGTVTLVPTGPLTNIAAALTLEPEIAPRIQEIVLMGGGRLEGNITPVAEFNIFVDPHAAAKVFGSGVRIVMHGLDVTHKALTTEARLRRVADLGTPVARAAAGLLDFYNRFDRERYGTPGAPLHDPCTGAYLLKPDLFAGKDCFVEVETAGLAAGMTAVDWWGARKREANAFVVTEIDADGFFDLLTERLGRL